MDSVSLGSLTDGERIPPGRLDQDVACLLGDHGIEATHNTGEADGLTCIGNHQVFGGELAFDAVKGLQRLTSASAADNYPAPLQQIEIKYVRRFTHFPKHIVGGVDGIGDCPLIE